MTEKQTGILISPSILSADFANLASEVKQVEQGGCDMIHVDVMDGHFVPNITIGAPVVKSLRKETKLPLDVHLMIDDPINYVKDFRSAGTDILTFHAEATEQIQETIDLIRSEGMKVGVSVKPKTPIDVLFSYLDQIDLVLIMTVEPGFGGQSFMPDMMAKIKTLKERYSGMISVDGGINAETAQVCLEAGANVLVAGTAIFAQPDRTHAINAIRQTPEPQE